MDAKQIAELIAQVTDLFLADRIEAHHHHALNTSLWELAQRKGLSDEVNAILQAEALAEMETARCAQ